MALFIGARHLDGNMTEANSINAATIGIVGNTGTSFTGTAVTQFNVIVGGATSSTLSNVAPSATSGVPLISQGAGSNPAFGTAVVAGGGTGATSFTAYAVLCGGTTTTNPIQSIASVGTAGQLLTSNGAGALPTFQTGNLFHIGSVFASGLSSIDFIQASISSFRMFVFFIGALFPGTDGANISLLVSTDGGATFLTTNYISGITYEAYNGTTETNQNTTAGYYVAYNVSSAGSTAAGSGYLIFSNGTSSSFGGSSISGQLSYLFAGTDIVSAHIQGRQTATTVNAFRFIASTGNLNGNVSLFGIT